MTSAKIGDEVIVRSPYGYEMTRGKITKIKEELTGPAAFGREVTGKTYYQIEGKGLYSEELVRPAPTAITVVKPAVTPEVTRISKGFLSEAKPIIQLPTMEEGKKLIGDYWNKISPSDRRILFKDIIRPEATIPTKSWEELTTEEQNTLFWHIPSEEYHKLALPKAETRY